MYSNRVMMANGIGAIIREIGINLCSKSVNPSFSKNNRLITTNITKPPKQAKNVTTACIALVNMNALRSSKLGPSCKTKSRQTSSFTLMGVTSALKKYVALSLLGSFAVMTS